MLGEYLRELAEVVCGAAGQPPKPTDLRIAEVAAGDIGVFGRLRLRRSQLKTPEEYSARFDELMSSGFSWLNLNYCGVFEGFGLVMVEYPRQRSSIGTPKIRTIVRFSGPMKLVADAGWDASAYVTISEL